MDTVPLHTEDIVKLILAMIAGGLIGVEREYRDKAAGFRTLIFICLGAALFTILSLRLGGEGDTTRIASSIVTGIGFLGAGVILRSEGGRIMGLTTAATIWLTAALGMSIGGGHYYLGAVVITIIMIVLWLFPYLERFFERARETRTYEIHYAQNPSKFEELTQKFENSGLHVVGWKQSKTPAEYIYLWDTYGSKEMHEKLAKNLIADPEVTEFHC